ncbi:MAG: hypothetical protein IJ877_03345 [Candidatus Gastranaerophilales bacterium]|nr:hypothetical protein [Candidatus Gastranaerophilales bacterium]
MAQQQVQGKIQVRNAVLVFCKDMATPIVLYFDNAQKIYDDLKAIINSTEVKMLEFEPIGPIRKASILSDRIVGVALQEERYLVQE